METEIFFSRLVGTTGHEIVGPDGVIGLDRRFGLGVGDRRSAEWSQRQRRVPPWNTSTLSRQFRAKIAVRSMVDRS